MGWTPDRSVRRECRFGQYNDLAPPTVFEGLAHLEFDPGVATPWAVTVAYVDTFGISQVILVRTNADGGRQSIDFLVPAAPIIVTGGNGGSPAQCKPPSPTICPVSASTIPEQVVEGVEVGGRLRCVVPDRVGTRRTRPRSWARPAKGKQQVAAQLMRMRKYVLTLDPKGGDTTLATLESRFGFPANHVLAPTAFGVRRDRRRRTHPRLIVGGRVEALRLQEQARPLFQRAIEEPRVRTTPGGPSTSMSYRSPPRPVA